MMFNLYGEFFILLVDGVGGVILFNYVFGGQYFIYVINQLYDCCV